MIASTATVIKKDGAFGHHLSLTIRDDVVKLEINGSRIFEVLAHREVIVGLLNKKFNELIQQYLETAMHKERDRNER